MTYKIEGESGVFHEFEEVAYKDDTGYVRVDEKIIRREDFSQETLFKLVRRYKKMGESEVISLIIALLDINSSPIRVSEVIIKYKEKCNEKAIEMLHDLPPKLSEVKISLTHY